MNNAADAVGVSGEVHRSLGVLFLPVSFECFVFTQDFQVHDTFHQFYFVLRFFIASDALLSIAQNTLFIKDPISNYVLAIDINSNQVKFIKQSLSILG